MGFALRVRDAVTPKGQRVAIVPMEPTLDATVTLEVRRQIQQIMDFGYNNLLLNLSQVTRFDSSGIGVLVSTLKRCRLASGHMAICSVPESVKLALEIASIDQILAIFPNEEQAIANFPH
jgi:anti-sigma B factor antagonist